MPGTTFGSSTATSASPRAAEAFLQTVEQALNRAAESPKMWSFKTGTRRYLVR